MGKEYPEAEVRAEMQRLLEQLLTERLLPIRLRVFNWGEPQETGVDMQSALMTRRAFERAREAKIEGLGKEG